VKVTALAGGTGAAKLLRGLVRVVDPHDVTVIGNTGDDTEVWGLHVSPDLDTVAYALAGRLDVARGWGLADETFHCLDAMATFGADTWFNVGDRDLATHLVRTRALRAGRRLSDVTAELARRLGASARILPMSDDRVRTRIETTDGWLDFQDYFVREKALPAVRAVAYEGAARAQPAPGVVDAIREADLVIVCPSNPVTSVGPILAVPGIVEALGASRLVIGVSPIIGGAPVSGPAGALMRARGLEVSATGVAAAYAPWLHALVIDARDSDAETAVAARGVDAVVTDTLMTDRATEIALARVIVDSGERAERGTRAGGERAERGTRAGGRSPGARESN
jgi:LPPG:FO 2-phospho-L-lactate transferase